MPQPPEIQSSASATQSACQVKKKNAASAPVCISASPATVTKLRLDERLDMFWAAVPPCHSIPGWGDAVAHGLRRTGSETRNRPELHKESRWLPAAVGSYRYSKARRRSISRGFA